MRFVPFALLVTAVVALAACNREREVNLTDATPAEVARAIKERGATRTMVRPGKWASTVTVVEMTSPGMPPEMQAMMKQRIGPPQTAEACLTADQVDNPERMIGAVPASCKYSRFQMGGGKMAGAMRCAADGVVQETTMSGTYSDDQYSLIINNRTTAPPGTIPGQPAADLSMKIKADSRRLGECDAKQTSDQPNGEKK